MKVKLYYDEHETLNEDQEYYRDVASESSNRAATDDYRQELNFIEKHVYRSGITSLAALDEDYITYHSGIPFRNFSPYFETFNDVKIWFESNGIMEKWRQDSRDSSTKPDELGPQILTMDHLKIGFLACLVPLVFSIAAFIAELVRSKVEIAIKKYVHRVLKSECKLLYIDLKNLLLEACHESDEVSFDQRNNVQNNFDDTDGIDSIGEDDDINEWVARCHFKRHVKKFTTK